MFNAVILFSGFKILHTLSGLADKLNEFFINAKLVDLVPIPVKAGVMKRGFKRLAGIVVCYVAASVSMGLLTYFILDDLDQEHGIDFGVTKYVARFLGYN